MPGHDDDRSQQRADQRRAPQQPFRRQGQRHEKRGQHGEQQPPFHQPAHREQRADQRHAQMRRPVEPQAGQRHRAQHQRVARHDVLADHRQQQDEAAAEMEGGGQRGGADAAGQAMDEGVDDDGGEAGEEGVEPGELPPRHAAVDAEPIEQPAERAVEREIEVVRRIEARARRIGDPGLGLDALVHAVGGDDVDVLQPGDQAAEHQKGKREGQQQLPANALVVAQQRYIFRPNKVTAPSGP